jgi:hypothetical protein
VARAGAAATAAGRARASDRRCAGPRARRTSSARCEGMRSPRTAPAMQRLRRYLGLPPAPPPCICRVRLPRCSICVPTPPADYRCRLAARR